jgi:hypothetical protein
VAALACVQPKPSTWAEAAKSGVSAAVVASEEEFAALVEVALVALAASTALATTAPSEAAGVATATGVAVTAAASCAAREAAYAKVSAVARPATLVARGENATAAESDSNVAACAGVVKALVAAVIATVPANASASIRRRKGRSL